MLELRLIFVNKGVPGIKLTKHELYVYHYYDIIMGAMASQITSLTNVYSTVYSGADQRKHQSSAPLAFVRAIHRWPVNSSHKWPVTRKMFPFDDVIMYNPWIYFTWWRDHTGVHSANTDALCEPTDLIGLRNRILFYWSCSFGIG